ncbi:MAG: hypothetical protein HC777_01750 [Hyphomonadaceae bacterium]|nr:hypothetical protein [Hyphomonadaceae bacterium]
MRDYLRDVGQDWIEDPSNDNRMFSRIKVRDRLAQLGGHDRLIAISAHAAHLREALDQTALALGQRSELSHCGAVVRFQIASFIDAPLVVQSRLLQLIIKSPRPLQLVKLERLVNSMTTDTFKRATLAGLAFARHGTQFVIRPEPERRQQTTP